MPDCRHQTTGDICAAGSPWSDFTQFRVQIRGEDHHGTTTMTMHRPDEFSIDIEDAPATHGTIIVVAGRAMIMKDVQHEGGYEIGSINVSRLSQPRVYIMARCLLPNLSFPSSHSALIV